MNTFTRCFAAMLILSYAVSGQSSQPTVAFVPFGPWPLCGTEQSIPYLGSLFGGANYCATLTKGSEPDLLSIKASNPLTTDFLYIVTGIDSTGISRTVTGHFIRKDNSAGFSSTIVAAGMTTALVTTVEYAYNPDVGSFLMLQSNTGLYQYPSAASPMSVMPPRVP
jgi:hypothetical protein